MLLSRKYPRAISISICLLIVVASLVLTASVFASDTAAADALRLLPDNVGGFKATNNVSGVIDNGVPQIFGSGAMMRFYASDKSPDQSPGYVVKMKILESDSEAFALLTRARVSMSYAKGLSFNDAGTASFDFNKGIMFFKGAAFVEVSAAESGSLEEAKNLARAIAAPIEGGEEDVPVLLKHLPDWQSAGPRAVYCVTLNELKQAANQNPSSPGQTVFDVLDFAGGTEAVIADYGPSQLVIVEFTTPQMSIDNDSRVWTKLAELKSQGQPTPNAYRRVGNYSVFVFNAPDDKAANALVDQVKYEQVVQWLGDDPHLADRLQRYFTQTSAGVLIAVLKSSGLSLILCLAVGGIIGALLFRHRRAQRAAAFSDAGGSIRLNLDELTGTENTRRLLSTSEESHNDPAS